MSRFISSIVVILITILQGGIASDEVRPTASDYWSISGFYPPEMENPYTWFEKNHRPTRDQLEAYGLGGRVRVGKFVESKNSVAPFVIYEAVGIGSSRGLVSYIIRAVGIRDYMTAWRPDPHGGNRTHTFDRIEVLEFFLQRFEGIVNDLRFNRWRPDVGLIPNRNDEALIVRSYTVYYEGVIRSIRQEISRLRSISDISSLETTWTINLRSSASLDALERMWHRGRSMGSHNNWARDQFDSRIGTVNPYAWNRMSGPPNQYEMRAIEMSLDSEVQVYVDAKNHEWPFLIYEIRSADETAFLLKGKGVIDYFKVGRENAKLHFGGDVAGMTEVLHFFDARFRGIVNDINMERWRPDVGLAPRLADEVNLFGMRVVHYERLIKTISEVLDR